MGFKTDDKVIEYLKRKFRESTSIVAIIGFEMINEGGCPDLDSNDETYRIEEIYGYTPDDMLACSFYNAKTEKFFKFYKNEILPMKIKSTPAYDALLSLQRMGKLKSVVSTHMHGMPSDVHFDNLIELNGNFSVNRCPRCDRSFPLDYMINSKGIPQCDSCKVAIRPDVRLIGERVDTELLTRVANACEKADIIMFLGQDMYHDRLEFCIDESKKQTKILFIKEDVFVTDRKVDFIIRDEIQKLLPVLIG